MKKELPVLDRIYQDPCYQAVCRAVGYFGILYRELTQKVEEFAKDHGKSRVESATWHLLSFEGQNRVNQSPLSKVDLRSDVRRFCFQLLGPPPETWDQHYRYPDGTPTSEHAGKMAELAARSGKKIEPKKRARKKAG